MRASAFDEAPAKPEVDRFIPILEQCQVMAVRRSTEKRVNLRSENEKRRPDPTYAIWAIRCGISHVRRSKRNCILIVREHQIIRGALGLDRPVEVTDAKFVKCQFAGAAFSLTTSLMRRSVARQLVFEHCSVAGCNIGPAIIEDVVVSDLFVADILIMWSPFLNRVIFRGEVGSIKVNNVPTIVDCTEAVANSFRLERESYYGSVEWALDISEATFKTLDIDGIPPAVIRRNPITQVVVSRQKALDQLWREKVSPRLNYWIDIIDVRLSDERDKDDFILVAPKRKSARESAAMIEGLRELQDLGIAYRD